MTPNKIQRLSLSLWIFLPLLLDRYATCRGSQCSDSFSGRRALILLFDCDQDGLAPFVWSLDDIQPSWDNVFSITPYEGELQMDYVAFMPPSDSVSRHDVVLVDNTHRYIRFRDSEGGPIFTRVGNVSSTAGLVAFGGTWMRTSQTGSSFEIKFRGRRVMDPHPQVYIDLRRRFESSCIRRTEQRGRESEGEIRFGKWVTLRGSAFRLDTPSRQHKVDHGTTLRSLVLCRRCQKGTQT